MKSRCMTAVALSVLWLIGCGGGEAGGEAGAPSGPIDEALAERGEQLFGSRGCVACHTVGGGRLVGPDLSGVTERRGYPWVMGMITNPDSMLANDATAKALLAEYLTPMSNQGVSRDEARALYEYLRGHDSEGSAGEAGGE